MGLNYALDPQTNQSHSELHIRNTKHESINQSHRHDELDLHKNYLEVKGNLREKLFTTTSLYSSIVEFNSFTKVLKADGIDIFNLSDGAYLEKTIPVKLDNLHMDGFDSFDKIKVNMAFRKELFSNSRNKLNNYDKVIIQRKIKNAKYISQLIKSQHSKTDYNNSEEFLSDLEVLLNKITKKEGRTNSPELNRILFEYTRLVSHYIYSLCESSELENQKALLTDVKNINEIFTSQLSKIADSYICAIEENMKKIRDNESV